MDLYILCLSKKLQVLYLLEGKAHAYIYPSKGLKRWDTAAPEAILKAAGGELTDAIGYNYSYNLRLAEEMPLNRYGVLANAPTFNRTSLQRRSIEIVDSVQRLHMTL